LSSFRRMILDLTRFNETTNFLGNETYKIVMSNIGRDITYIMSSRGLKQQAACLQDMYSVAFLDVRNAGCFITDVVLIISLLVIGGVVSLRLVIALFFGLFVGRRLGDHDNKVLKAIISNKHTELNEVSVDYREKRMTSRFTPKRSIDSRSMDSRLEVTPTSARRSSQPDVSFMDPGNPYIDPASEALLTDPNLLHTLIMVPCYSEGLESMKATLDSCVQTDYPATHKCILVVADGIIQGSGNDKPTHEYVTDLMEIDQ
jgi:chitin synthase